MNLLGAVFVVAAIGAALLWILPVALAPLRRAQSFAVLGAVILVFVLWPGSRALRTLLTSERPAPFLQASYLGSPQCKSCHPSHHDSWWQTYHRTMTQEASAETILGDFAGQTLEFDGGSVRLERHGDVFAMELLGPSREEGLLLPLGTHRIDRVIGSHEIQVYLTERSGGLFLTLPFEWNIREQRWVTSAGNYLQPDEGRDLRAHIAPWNANCSYCHTTRVRPRYRGQRKIEVNAAVGPLSSGAAGRYDTQVEELAIGCEACHSPGSFHDAANSNPVRRYTLHLTGTVDATIVNPARQAPHASLETCGRCHGKFFARPEWIDASLESGDPWVPGSGPIRATLEDPLSLVRYGRDPAGFFWPDGTPQPTSMEYQGTLASACHVDGGMTCTSCHSMHNANPDAQLRHQDDPASAGREDDALCTECHRSIDAQRHSNHSESVGCVDCHMPYQSFGLMKAVRSHRITVPNLSESKYSGMPNACTQCHTDRSLDWAAAALTGTALTSGDTASQTLRELTEGHGLSRALAAAALGRSRYFSDVDRCALIDALDDSYAAVRHEAALALRRHIGAVHFDYLAVPAARLAQRRALKAAHCNGVERPARNPDPRAITVYE